MRLLVIVLTILLFIGFLFFVLNNLDTRVQVQVMETEIHYLRTQRVGAPRPEPDAVDEEALAQTGAAGGEVRPDPASAPVYGAEGEWSGDDDDAYSGGRAV
jgi:hypothetical protein